VRATVMNNCGEDEKSVSVSYTKSCPSPTVSITSPGNGSKLNTNKVTINGTALNVSQKSNIDIRINGSSVNFSYNASNNKFSATVTLKTGVNSIMVSVKTECGVDSEVVSVTYSQPCNAPSILINSPKHKAELVSSSSLLKGSVTGIKSGNQIELSVNGIRQAVNYSSLSSEFSTMLKLVAGTNRINISVRNECGEDAKSIQVNYTPPCPKPTVKILTPKNDLTINDNKVIVTGIATSLVNASDLMIKVNGVSQPVNYSFSTRSFTATVVLTPNIRNTIVAIVETNCGMASQSISVTSVQVQKPVIDLENPATDSSTTTFDNAKLFGSVSGITTPAKFEIRVNGTKVTDYILTKRGLEYYTFNGVLTLVNGVNVISIKATHSSGGVEIKTIIITKSGVNYMKSPNKIGGSEKTKEITPAKSTPTRSRNKR
ncbi:MAG: Ig-like domain-containing protein, partial [Flavobacteriales bacterium]